MVERNKSRVLNLVMGKQYPVIVKGEGVYLYDETGKRYLDGAGGSIVVNVGHGLKEFAEILKQQAEQVAFTYRIHFSHTSGQELARKLFEVTKGEMDKTFFVSGGSEATEISVKLARKFHIDDGNPSKFKIISRWQSYHGSTMGALSWSGHTYRRKDYVDYLKDFNHIPPAYCYRCWFKQNPESCDLECANALEDAILCEGPETVAAFIAEPIVGAALAAAVPREGYFERIRRICDQYNVLLILDEVMTGFGRTGKFFAYEHFHFSPDIIATGKGMSGGYYPLGGVLATLKVTETIARESGSFIGGYTYAGNPLGCAVGNKMFDYLEKHNLVEQCAEKGNYFFAKAEKLKCHPTVGDIRGKGLMIGIEFVKDKRTKAPLDSKMRFSDQVFEEALNQGLTTLPCSGCDRGQEGNMIMLGPPFSITHEQIDEVINIINDVLFVVEIKMGFG